MLNYNTTGYIAPAWNTNGQVTDPAPDTPVLPVNSGKMTEEGDAILYSVNGNTPYDGEIYTFESLAAEDAGGVGQDGEASRKDATCLIVKGRIGTGESTFYRVDFTKTGNTGEQVEYLPLKRNHKYIITNELLAQQARYDVVLELLRISHVLPLHARLKGWRKLV